MYFRVRPMCQKSKSFWQVTIKHKLFFVINFGLLGVARAGVLLLPLKRITPYLGVLHRNMVCSTVVTPKQCYLARQIRCSIAMAAKHTPWHSNCLTQVMVAKFWCMRLKIPYVLYIGVKKDSQKPNGYASHAWIMAGPIAMAGGHAYPGYHVLSAYMPAAYSSCIAE